MNIGTACCRRPDCADTECEGRPDPALLALIAASGQMDSRQQYEHERAGDFLPVGDSHSGIVGHGFRLTESDVGVECALPPIVTDELWPAREPWRVSDIALVVSVLWLWGCIVYLRFWG